MAGRAGFAKEGEDLGLDGDVEGGGGLVGDEQARAVDERHGDEDALTLAAGELVRIIAQASCGRIRQGDFVEGVQDAAADFFGEGCGGDWANRASAICVPMRMTGLRAVIGSWKIMAISRPRRSTHSSR